MGDFQFSPWALGLGTFLTVAAWTAYPNGTPDWLLAVGLGAFAWTLPHAADFLLAVVRETVRIPTEAYRARMMAWSGAQGPTPAADEADDEPPPDNRVEQRALANVRAVLSAARAEAGLAATLVPRWEHLTAYDITRPMWSKATDDLQAAGYLVKFPSDRTELTWAGTLGKLYALMCRPDASLERPAPDNWPREWDTGERERANGAAEAG